MWILLASIIGSASLGAWIWLAYRQPWRGARTRYPIVLAHGAFGFDEIHVGGAKQEYFRGVGEHLEALGVQVYRPRVPAVGSIEDRAKALAQSLEEIPAQRVNIIAHSMGGLDARYAISNLGMASKVASLTTIGTPHHGTPVADMGKSLSRKLRMRRVLGRMGIDKLFALTTERMRTFNERTGDVRSVRYASVVAAAKTNADKMPLLLRPVHARLRATGVESDGLIPVDSQRWGECLAVIDADHWAQIGWSPAFDAKVLYEWLANSLRARRC